MEDFSKIGMALRKELLGGELPPSIPCRDTLIRIVVNIEKDYKEAERLYDLFVQKALLTEEEAQGELENLRFDKLYDAAERLLKEGSSYEEAKSILEEVAEMDERTAPIYRTLGDYYLESKMEEKALQCFRKAIVKNPLISGVKRNPRNLSKKLGVEVELDEEEALNILQKREDRKYLVGKERVGKCICRDKAI